MSIRTPAAGLIALILCGAVSGPMTAADKDGVAGGKNIYQRALKSTAWIVNLEDVGGGRVRVSSGSGSIVSVPDRLVLTNYHVVRDSTTATVMFPIFQKGELVPERDRYMNVVRSNGGIKGKVVYRDPKVDLALIQLPSLPAGTTALKLAADGVGPGDDVHSIGNPGASGALWVYTRGSVKAVYRKHFRTSGLGGEGAFEVDAKVVETSSPVNAGDSGGPVLNGAGELVAVTQGHLSDEAARSISYFIDISEVKGLLKRAGFGRVISQRPTVVTAAAEKTEEKAAPPAKESAADHAEKEEKAARAKLSLIRQYIDERPDRARERLNELITQYPNTKAAREAKELLAKLK